MFRMKKVLALLFAALLLVSLAGCNKTEEPKVTTEPKLADNLTVHSNTFFTVGYDEKDGWVLEEDDIYMSEYGGSAYLQILDEDGYTDVLVKIIAEEESASSFRSTLYDNEVDLKAYADGSWVTEEVGGVKLAVVEGEDDDRYFYGRNEAAGVSYAVKVSPWSDTKAQAVVKNIRFTASATDNVDPPWPWAGEPISGGTLSKMVGTYNLTAQFLPIKEAQVTFETFNHDLAVVGDKVYLLSDYALYQYGYDGSSLSRIKEISLPGEYDLVDKVAGSNIILSGFMEPVLGHNGDAPQFSYDGPDNFTAAPDGTWGISWFVSGDDCEKYTFQNGTLTGDSFPFAEVDTISRVCIDGKYILVSGSSVADDEHYVFVYDYSGKLQLQLGGEPGGFGLGSVTYATSTPNGFLALDGNMREVVLWTADGTWIGSVDDGDLFGTDYPWFAAADMAEDGSIFIVMSDERPDESADEVIVFRLTGF